jgi:tetratricopeptide (TPR) repeat protein
MIGDVAPSQQEMMFRQYEEADRQAKNAKPYPRPKKDAYKAISGHEQMIIQTKDYNKNKNNKNESGYRNVRFNFISNKEHFSSKKLEDLTPIKLKEMQVNKIHAGRFLLCRTIHDAFYVTGTIVLVQDSDGEVEHLSLYNFSNSYLIDAKILLPRDSILIVKEPYMKNMLSSPKDFHIRVESPTDLIILSDLDKDEKYAQYFLPKWTKNLERSLSFDAFNRKGNEFFVGKDYHSAIRYYTKALNLAKEDTTAKTSDVKKTLTNRAAAFLKLDKFYRAYLDTVKSSQIDDANDSGDAVNNEKTFYRMGKAAYSMRQFDVALEAFEKCLKHNPQSREAKEEIARTKARLYESSTGKYDMKSIVQQALVQKKPRLDLADYVSDDIEIRNINNDSNYKGMYYSIFLSAQI